METFKYVLNFLKPYLIIIVVVVLIRTFIITPGVVNGDSMNSTLHDGEVVLVNKIGKHFSINRFDIVVVKYDGGEIIKRVIGLPGETVKYADNVLYINGKEVVSDYVFEDTDDFTLEAGKNEYVVLGDNRDISKDSRILGAFNKKDIVGKVGIRILPFRSIGTIK